MIQANNKIAVVILTKNEAANIERCLKSVTWTDEIVLVDDLSCDETVNIAKNYGARIFSRKLDDFASQREYGAGCATSQWVFSLDADEEVTPELAEEIKSVVRSGRHSAYQVAFKQHFFGKWLKHGGWYPAYRIRLYDRTRCHWGKQIHEKIDSAEPVGRLKNAIVHYSHQTISQFLEMLNHYTDMEAQSRYQQGIRTNIGAVAGRPLRTFLAHYVLHQGFRDGAHGLVVAVLMAFYKFSWQAKLWEMGYRERHPEKIGRGPDW